jgi:hypothetical protein
MKHCPGRNRTSDTRFRKPVAASPSAYSARSARVRSRGPFQCSQQVRLTPVHNGLGRGSQISQCSVLGLPSRLSPALFEPWQLCLEPLPLVGPPPSSAPAVWAAIRPDTLHPVCPLLPSLALLLPGGRSSLLVGADERGADTFPIDPGLELKYAIPRGHPCREPIDKAGWSQAERVPAMLDAILVKLPADTLIALILASSWRR